MLRPYQLKLIDDLRQSYKNGNTSPCIVAPCGSGKSIISAELAKKTTDKGNRILFLVHRQELCAQIGDTFNEWGVNMQLCEVGMVQTITRRLNKTKEPALIITDENHHCLAKSYKRIYEHFPNAKRVGMTATPVRLNGGGLGDINDDLVMGPSVKWLTENGYLAPFDYYAPSVADMTGVRTSRGEYVTSDIEEKLNTRTVYGDVIRHYNALSADKQAICYCASVEHSKAMAEQFCESGIWAEHIDGTTPKSERKYIIEGFRAGEVMILCNVDLISEGFDVPDCNTCILLRPTKSLTLYTQQSMRCMRPKLGKRAVVIDHVGNYTRFGLPDTDRVWSLDPKRKSNVTDKENSIKVRQCPECFYTHEPAPDCPACGYEYPVKSRELKEDKSASLELIEGFVLDYTSPDDCTTYAELQAYGMRKGYKKGWAFYQARSRGMISA